MMPKTSRRYATLDQFLADVDFAKPGIQSFGFPLGLKTSTQLEFARWPLLVFNGSQGPTVLLTAGVHGDEFEGPALLTELVKTIDPGCLRGRLIVAPAMNPPALHSRQRRSPWDGMDLNRSFSSRSAAGGPTVDIARAVSSRLVPLADAVIDLHAGGLGYVIVPSVMVHPRATLADSRPSIAAMLAFGAPVSLLIREREADEMFDGEVERQSKIFVCAELGSLGCLTPETLDIGRRGLRNLLVHFGMVDGVLFAPSYWRDAVPRLLAAPDGGEIVANRSGFFVPTVDVGTIICEGSEIGTLIDPSEPMAPSRTIVTPRDGCVYLRAAGGPVAEGDNLATIASVVRDVAELEATAGWGVACTA